MSIYDGSSWQPFPSDGVDGDTRVRYYVPDNVDWQFGVLLLVGAGLAQLLGIWPAC